MFDAEVLQAEAMREFWRPSHWEMVEDGLFRARIWRNEKERLRLAWERSTVIGRIKFRTVRARHFGVLRQREPIDATCETCGNPFKIDGLRAYRRRVRVCGPGCTGRASVARKVTLDGKTMSIAKWARLRGLKARTVRSRLQIGLSVEQALSPSAKAPATPEHVREEIRAQLETGLPVQRVAEALKIRPSTVYKIAWKMRKREPEAQAAE